MPDQANVEVPRPLRERSRRDSRSGRPLSSILFSLFCLSCVAITLNGCGTSGLNDSPATTSMSTHSTSEPSTERNITTINGSVLPARMLPEQNVTTMLDTIDANGERLVIVTGTRKAGTRAAIHTHDFGGHTCVLSGVITDFIEGHEPMQWPAGTCYYMPPNKPMAAASLGDKDAILIDTFILPPDAEPIFILEPGYPGGPGERIEN